MDMAPPQAPPAIVSSTQQETVDALDRLVSVQSWLAAQQRDVPAPPARPATEARESWLASLDVFWQQSVADTPGAAPVPRIDALASRLASTMRDDAVVQRLDGTLGAAAANLAERVARSPGGNLPPDVEVRSLRIGTVDYAGALIVTARDDPARVIRFMPDRGWEAFDSLDHLHAQTEVHLRQTWAHRRELPGIRADDVDRLIAAPRFVDSMPMQTDVFLAAARRLVALQREKVEDAWLAADETATSAQFIDEATSALDLHDKLDIVALLAEREERLLIALNERRLARVPENVAQGWRDAMEGHRLARLLAASSARQGIDEAPLTLAAWSERELAAAFARRRIGIHPDDIQIEVSGSDELSLPTIGATPALASTRLTVAEFGLRNAGFFDGRRLRVVTDGAPSGAPVPSIHVLREIARELNLAPRFESYLRERVSDPQGRRFRNATMRLQQSRMRAEAAEARMASYLRDEPAVFLDDREERGYRMVEAVLDGPAAATRRTVGAHRVSVHQLVYRSAVVSDVLIMGVRDARSSPRVVLYTPGAPDGRPFREFGDRATATREFLYAPAFREYLLGRLPVEYGEPLPNGSGRRFRVSDATRRTHWVVAAPGEGRGTMTEEAFAERVVEGDVRTALFDAEIVRQARDVAWLGRSTAQADLEAITGVVHSVLRSARGPESLIEDTAGAVGQALRATWRFYDSVKAGDGNQAFVDFTEAYTASLSIAGWYAGTSLVAPRLSLRPGGNGLRRADAFIPFVDARQWLDPRYAVHGIDLSGTRPDAWGVHRLNGGRYIRQHERVFELRHDSMSDTWRLARPNALDAVMPGPAVTRTSAGGWRLRTDVGLRGGGTDHAAMPQPRSRGVSGQDIEGLTEFQRWTFQQSLIRRLRNGGEASLIYWEATTQRSPRWVTLRQRTAWNDALRTARATPPEPLSVGAEPATGASWRVVPQSEWPNQLWHYPWDGVAIGGDGPLALPLQALPGSGLIGLPATARAPVNARDPAWIRLHLDRYRNRLGTTASPGIRVIEDLRGPEPAYVIQPDVGVPVSFLALESGDFTSSSRAPH